MTDTKAMNEAFKEMANNFAQTFQVGMKFYEGSAKLWTDMATSTVDEGRTRYEATAQELNEVNKRNLERFHKFLEEQAQRGASVTPYMVDPTTVSNPAELCDRMAAAWRLTFESMRDSVDAAAKATTEMIQGWSQIHEATEANKEKDAAKK